VFLSLLCAVLLFTCIFYLAVGRCFERAYQVFLASLLFFYAVTVFIQYYCRFCAFINSIIMSGGTEAELFVNKRLHDPKNEEAAIRELTTLGLSLFCGVSSNFDV
jgi:hypothetical protein